MSERVAGALAYGFHEGGRSEYLGLYAFSAFGAASLVPRQEDYGLDLLCGIGEQVGHRLLIRNTYYVQIKSTKDDLVFGDPESVRWFCSLIAPFFICVVDKRTSQLEVYQTLDAVRLRGRATVDSITLTHAPRLEETLADLSSVAPHAIVRLGEPILRFEVDDLADKNRRSTLAAVLYGWIACCQRNIDSVRTGVPIVHLPVDYTTNEWPLPEWQMFGNLDDVTDDTRRRFDDTLLRTIAAALLQAAIDENRSSYHFFQVALAFHSWQRAYDQSPGQRLLAEALKAGAERLGSQANIVAFGESGQGVWLSDPGSVRNVGQGDLAAPREDGPREE